MKFEEIERVLKVRREQYWASVVLSTFCVERTHRALRARASCPPLECAGLDGALDLGCACNWTARALRAGLDLVRVADVLNLAQRFSAGIFVSIQIKARFSGRQSGTLLSAF